MLLTASLRGSRSLHSAAVACRCALSLAALSFAPGCSYLFVEGPPPEHAQLQYFDCTTSRAAPVTDTVFAVLYGLSAVAPAADSNFGKEQGIAVAALAGVALFEAASAAHGFSRISKCEAAKKQWAERHFARPPGACGSDRDCKGVRVCEAGLCVQPRAMQPELEPPPAAVPAAAEPAAQPSPPPAR